MFCGVCGIEIVCAKISYDSPSALPSEYAIFTVEPPDVCLCGCVLRCFLVVCGSLVVRGDTTETQREGGDGQPGTRGRLW